MAEGIDPHRTAVVGGGIGGLSAAYYLSRAGHEVTVFEAAAEFGGLASTFEHAGHHFDRFYHVLLPSDDDLLGLLGELGMESGVYWREASLGFYYGGELYPLATPLDLLRFSPVALTDRIRLGLTALYTGYVARPEPLDDLRLTDWLTRISGRRAFARLWEPLLFAKFGDAYREIPALWYWASFRREKGTGREVKGYLKGGYRAITERLLEQLTATGVELTTDTAVERVALTDGGRCHVAVAGEWRTFDTVLVTTPWSGLRKLLAGGDFEDRLRDVDPGLDYQGVVNVLLMLKRSASPHYWAPVVASECPFDGMVETTRVIRTEDSADRHLLYLLNYVHRSSPLFARSDDSILEEYVPALLSLVPELRESDIEARFVFRRPRVEPIWTPGYSRRRPPVELVPGTLYAATTAHVYPNVTSWNSSIGVVREAIAALLGRRAA